MMTLTPNDEAERYQSRAERLVIATRAERIGKLDIALTHIMPMSLAAIEARNKKILGGATMNGNQIFNPRINNSAPPKVAVTLDQDAYDRVAQEGAYAPLAAKDDVVVWTDLPVDKPAFDKYRAVNEPLAKLKGVDPNATEKIDAEDARVKVDEALRNIPDTTLELPL